MKYYIIYKNDHFQGYTTDKALLKNFLKNRKGKYRVQKLDEEEIDSNLLKSDNFYHCELGMYASYYNYSDTPLFEYEMIDMEEHLIQDALALQSLVRDTLKNIKYLELKDEERKLINYCFKRLDDILDDVTNNGEAIFDEVFDIRKYVYKEYLPNRKSTKHIMTNSIL